MLTDNFVVRGNNGNTVDIGNIFMDPAGNDLTIPGLSIATSFNGVILTTAGGATNFLNEAGSYSAPAGSLYIQQKLTTAATINSDTELVISTGTHILTMPLSNSRPLTIMSVSGVATLNAGGNTFSEASVVDSATSRTFILDGTIWRDL